MIKTEVPTHLDFYHLRLQSVRALWRRLTSRDSLDTTLLIIAVSMALLMTVGFAIPAIQEVNNQAQATGPTVNPEVNTISPNNPLVIENPVR